MTNNINEEGTHENSKRVTENPKKEENCTTSGRSLKTAWRGTFITKKRSLNTTTRRKTFITKKRSLTTTSRRTLSVTTGEGH